MNKHQIFARGLFAFAIFIGAFAVHAQKPERSATESDRKSTAKLVYGLMSDPRYAYRARRFDDTLSSQVFDAYVDALDPSHQYFSQADLQELDKYRLKLADALKRGALEPVYEIADVQERAATGHTGARSRDEVLEIFLNAYASTADAGAYYYSPFVDTASEAADATAATPSMAARSMLETGGKRLGVITLGNLYGLGNGSVSKDVERLIGELKRDQVDGMILDLRASPGGVLREALSLLGLFLGQSPVLQVRETGGRVSVESTDTASSWDGPLAVLVDGKTASGSEVVAAAIQDRGRGLVVGAPTFGGGSIRNSVSLDVGISGPRRFGGVRLTIAEMFRIDGRPLEGVGVVPDLASPIGTSSSRRAARSPASSPISAIRGFQAPTQRYDVAALAAQQQARAADPIAGPDPALAEAASILVDAIKLQPSSAQP